MNFSDLIQSITSLLNNAKTEADFSHAEDLIEQAWGMNVSDYTPLNDAETLLTIQWQAFQDSQVEETPVVEEEAPAPIQTVSVERTEDDIVCFTTVIATGTDRENISFDLPETPATVSTPTQESTNTMTTIKISKSQHSIILTLINQLNLEGHYTLLNTKLTVDYNFYNLLVEKLTAFAPMNKRSINSILKKLHGAGAPAPTQETVEAPVEMPASSEIAVVEVAPIAQDSVIEKPMNATQRRYNDFVASNDVDERASQLQEEAVETSVFEKRQDFAASWGVKQEETETSNPWTSKREVKSTFVSMKADDTQQVVVREEIDYDLL